MSIVVRDVREHELDSVLALNNAAGPAILPLDAARLRHFFDTAEYFRVALNRRPGWGPVTVLHHPLWLSRYDRAPRRLPGRPRIVFVPTFFSGDVRRVEVNEAFCSVALNSTRMLEADPESVNVNGGAVALGHPIGASGARILSTMIHELRRQGGGLGLAAICSGGGQGDALLLEV